MESNHSQTLSWDYRIFHPKRCSYAINDPNSIYHEFRQELFALLPDSGIKVDTSSPKSFHFRFHKREYDMSITHQTREVDVKFPLMVEHTPMIEGQISLEIIMPQNESKHDRWLIRKLKRRFGENPQGYRRNRLFPYQSDQE